MTIVFHLKPSCFKSLSLSLSLSLSHLVFDVWIVKAGVKHNDGKAEDVAGI